MISNTGSEMTTAPRFARGEGSSAPAELRLVATTRDDRLGQLDPDVPRVAQAAGDPIPDRVRAAGVSQVAGDHEAVSLNLRKASERNRAPSLEPLRESTLDLQGRPGLRIVERGQPGEGLRVVGPGFDRERALSGRRNPPGWIEGG